MNSIVLVGFIGKKGVELKFSTNGKAVASYSLSVPRMKKGEYDFINCVTWGNQAEFIANNAEKIRKVAIQGRIQSRSYDKKDGSKAYVTEIITNEVEVVEWNNATNNIGNNDYNEAMTLEDYSETPF